MREERKIGLDLIRSIAILCVVLLHLVIAFGILNKKNTLWLPIPGGVDIFFVLSGYLIGGIIIKTFNNNGINKKNVLEFWLMRWFRTLPNYYLFTFIVFVLNRFHIPWRNLVFMQNFHKFYANPYFETWSLCVEEWFYLLFPVCVFAISYFSCKKIFHAVLLTAIFMMSFSICMRFYFYFYVYPNHLQSDFLIVRSLAITRFDSIAYGIFGAVIKYFYPIYWNKNVKLSFVFGILLFVFLTLQESINNYLNHQIISFYIWNIRFIIYSLSIILMFPYLENITIKNSLIKKFITNTSTISYSMYLIHSTILFKIMGVFCIVLKINNYLLLVFIYLPLLYILCNLNYRLFESNFINYRIIFIRKYLK